MSTRSHKKRSLASSISKNHFLKFTVNLLPTKEFFLFKKIHRDMKISQLKCDAELKMGLPADVQRLRYLDKGDLLDDSLIRTNDIVPNALLDMEVWSMWEQLIQAVVSNDIDLVLKLGVTQDSDYNTPNSKYMNPRARKKWLAERAFMALFIAAHRGHAKLVEQLIVSGVDVNATTSHGRTALHAAAASGNGAILDTLLEHGADIDAEDSEGNNALAIASRFGHKDCERHLFLFTWQQRAKDKKAEDKKQRQKNRKTIQMTTKVNPRCHGKNADSTGVVTPRSRGRKDLSGVNKHDLFAHQYFDSAFPVWRTGTHAQIYMMNILPPGEFIGTAFNAARRVVVPRAADGGFDDLHPGGIDDAFEADTPAGTMSTPTDSPRTKACSSSETSVILPRIPTENADGTPTQDNAGNMGRNLTAIQEESKVRLVRQLLQQLQQWQGTDSLQLSDGKKLTKDLDQRDITAQAVVMMKEKQSERVRVYKEWLASKVAENSLKTKREKQLKKKKHELEQENQTIIGPMPICQSCSVSTPPCQKSSHRLHKSDSVTDITIDVPAKRLSKYSVLPTIPRKSQERGDTAPSAAEPVQFHRPPQSCSQDISPSGSKSRGAGVSTDLSDIRTRCSALSSVWLSTLPPCSALSFSPLHNIKQEAAESEKSSSRGIFPPTPTSSVVPKARQNHRSWGSMARPILTPDTSQSNIMKIAISKPTPAFSKYPLSNSNIPTTSFKKPIHSKYPSNKKTSRTPAPIHSVSKYPTNKKTPNPTPRPPSRSPVRSLHRDASNTSNNTGTPSRMREAVTKAELEQKSHNAWIVERNITAQRDVAAQRATNKQVGGRSSIVGMGSASRTTDDIVRVMLERRLNEGQQPGSTGNVSIPFNMWMHVHNPAKYQEIQNRGRILLHHYEAEQQRMSAGKSRSTAKS